jgi:hypothetical protein
MLQRLRSESRCTTKQLDFALKLFQFVIALIRAAPFYASVRVENLSHLWCTPTFVSFVNFRAALFLDVVFVVDLDLVCGDGLRDSHGSRSEPPEDHCGALLEIVLHYAEVIKFRITCPVRSFGDNPPFPPLLVNDRDLELWGVRVQERIFALRGVVA